MVFGGLDPDDAEYMARIMFRGEFDLQRAKQRLIKPQVVGVERAWLDQESATDKPELGDRPELVARERGDEKCRDDQEPIARQGVVAHRQCVQHPFVGPVPQRQREHRIGRYDLGRGERFVGHDDHPRQGSIEDALMLSGPQTVSYSDGSGTSASHTTGTVVSHGSSEHLHGRRLPLDRHGRQPFDVDQYRQATTEGTSTTASTQEGGSSSQRHRASSHARPGRSLRSYI